MAVAWWALLVAHIHPLVHHGHLDPAHLGLGAALLWWTVMIAAMMLPWVAADARLYCAFSAADGVTPRPERRAARRGPWRGVCATDRVYDGQLHKPPPQGVFALDSPRETRAARATP